MSGQPAAYPGARAGAGGGVAVAAGGGMHVGAAAGGGAVGGGVGMAGPVPVAGGYCMSGNDGSVVFAAPGGTAYGPAVSATQATSCCGPVPALGTAGGFSAGFQASPVPYRAGAAMSAGAGAAVDGAASCGMPWGCFVGEECHGGSGVMMNVAPNSGDWQVETTYKYVGAGKGNVMFVAGKRKSYCGLLCCLILLLVLILLIFQEVNTTTRYQVSPAILPDEIPEPELGTCRFWGDPHLVTFDGARPSFYGDGDYWIVKSDHVQIQGRYLGTKYTYGLACVNQVALTGDWVGDNLIFVPTMDGGDIEVNGEVVCSELGCEKQLADGVTLKYNTEGDLVDEAASKFDKNIVHVYSEKRNVKMTIFRWANYMDLEITMPKTANVDGSCGNFNGEPSDDTDTAIFARIGARVPTEDRLFENSPTIEFTPEEADVLNTVSHDELEAAKTVCKEELSGSDSSAVMLKSCMIDQLKGSDEHLLRTARTFVHALTHAFTG